ARRSPLRDGARLLAGAGGGADHARRTRRAGEGARAGRRLGLGGRHRGRGRARSRRGRRRRGRRRGGGGETRAGRAGGSPRRGGGDSPLSGAGTYADGAAGAVSTTGHGEGMIRVGAARVAAIRMGEGRPAEDAVRSVIEELGARVGSMGGVIAIDRDGRWGWS